MRSLRNIFLLIPAFIYGVSCQVIEEIQYDENVKILVSINDEYQTRVSDDGKSFVEGDEIQVVNMSRETNNSATFIYDGMGWSTEDVILWSAQGDNVFKAWHPADASFDSFTIPTNQSAGLGGSDWMTAQSTARPSDGGVSLRFSRHLTKVKVTIESWGDEYADSEKKVARLDLMSSSSVMSNDGNEIAGNSTPTPVITYILEEDRSMVAIIAPGEYSAGDEFMNVYINGNFSEPLKVYTAKQLILHPGMAYELKLIIGRDRIEISPDAIYVTDWDDEILDDQIVSEQAVVDLSAQGTANSYIVSSSGAYKFTPAKGNSDESVVSIASAVVLWESFGTDVTPNVGDLVKNVKYVDGKICFETPDTFKEGNALIAAKDADGTILWSWHIWLTDQPEEQVYYNDAGTMMDRNLGATSATPGDVGALGLLYQWGRKDPFLGSSSISEAIDAASTITWPSAVSSTASTGTIAYAIANPTSFITSVNNDWCYPYSSTDNTRWTTSLNRKSIYDPCPSGWRISDGGDDGVWSKALGSAVYFQDPSLYDETNKGMNLSGKLGSDAIIWYPASSYRDDEDGNIYDTGGYYYSWTSYTVNYRANYTFFDYNGVVNPARFRPYSFGFSVRCAREVMTPSTPQAPEVVNLSEDGTANSYIVSQKGSYKFSTVKGNSSESVGAVASAEVLWETFGTDVTPNVGDLVKNVSYKNGEVTFQTADTFKEGNAVIAAKDASGTILWSWHIWLTDEPQGQVYYNNAGTMMDRNLGATSATPGDVGALGLLYQWGRKDPFLGSSSISEGIKACSTTSWSSAVESDSSNGTLEYAIANPTTFISANNLNNDWYYTGTSLADDTRWTGSESTKTIYDPCPRGWRVPDGGDNGVWAKAVGSTSSLSGYQYQQSNEGINFSGVFGASSVIWYPTPGGLNYITGSLEHVGYSCRSWASSAYRLFLDSTGYLTPAGRSTRAYGYTVRCVSENPELEVPEEPSEPEPSQPSYSLHLKPSTYGWVKSSTVLNPDASLYDGVYESTNQGVNDTKSVMYIDINGYDEFTFYVRSYAESNYDYVQVSNLDTDISSLKMTTKGNQQSGTSLSSYTEVTFTNIGGGQHRITVVYVKDYSQHSADDKGYVLIPKNQGVNTPEAPSEPQDGDYVDEYGINHGQGIEIDDVVWAPVNCGYHATDYQYGKLYQWGRKYGQGYSRDYDASVPLIVSGPVSLSVGQSSENSNSFYTSIISYNYDWITPQYNTLWNSGTDDNPVKTEYDPCPEGWRVPTYAELDNLRLNKSSWTANNGQNGYWFSGSNSYSEFVYRVFFPAAGFRQYDGEISERGVDGNYWSSRPDSDWTNYLNFYSSKVQIISCRRAWGLSVRCVQE